MAQSRTLRVRFWHHIRSRLKKKLIPAPQARSETRVPTLASPAPGIAAINILECQPKVLCSERFRQVVESRSLSTCVKARADRGGSETP
jgi:hypothetical protein